MRTIHVISVPLKEVFDSIAKSFSVPFTEDCEEYCIRIPPELGEGFIRGIQFSGGLRFIQYECVFKEDLEIRFTRDKAHLLKFLYVVEGEMFHKFEKDAEPQQIAQHQSAIVASTRINGHSYQFKAGRKLFVNSVGVERNKFREKMKCNLKDGKFNLKKVFNDVHGKDLFFHIGSYSLVKDILFNRMKKYDKGKFIRKLYFEGMIYQILAEQILRYDDDIKAPEHRSVLRSSELELIKKAASIIEAHISETQTVEALAREVGLNINKLQEGFKVLYRSTVNNYVQRTRLKMSHDLLLNTEYSMSEITNVVGLSSKSYFSKIFKEAYQVSPSSLRNQNKNRKK